MKLAKDLRPDLVLMDIIIKGDQSWKEFVPKQVREFLGEIDGEARLKKFTRR